MSGPFCPHDFHEMKDEDLLHMMYGEDYYYFNDVYTTERALRHNRVHKHQYVVHDKAIALAKEAGKVFGDLTPTEQGKLMDAAELLLKES